MPNTYHLPDGYRVQDTCSNCKHCYNVMGYEDSCDGSLSVVARYCGAETVPFVPVFYGPVSSLTHLRPVSEDLAVSELGYCPKYSPGEPKEVSDLPFDPGAQGDVP